MPITYLTTATLLSISTISYAEPPNELICTESEISQIRDSQDSILINSPKIARWFKYVCQANNVSCNNNKRISSFLSKGRDAQVYCPTDRTALGDNNGAVILFDGEPYPNSAEISRGIYVLNDAIFSAKSGNIPRICNIAYVDLHERLHVTSGVIHSNNTEVYDWIYAASLAAFLVCEDSFALPSNSTDKVRFFESMERVHSRNTLH